MNLGAPILSADVGGATVKTTSTSTTTTPTNTGTTNTNTNKGGSNTTTTVITNTTKNGGSKTGIVTNTTNIIYETEDTPKGEGNLTLMIAIVAVIVALIIVSVIAGVIIYKKCKKPSGTLDINQTVKSNPAEASSNNNLNNSPGPEEENYEPQYHPKAELGNIFTGKTDPNRKINNADHLEEIKDQNDEENQVVHTNQSNIDAS